ncbi:hypothetical protein UFOVP338_69 [uncultured Caudovirales phage]|uniref:Uncharacterized protein n=1 Tax=uncultured Caudovirales phage TaxID=2100421 RepID=A0A6J5M0G0_9CAUD|nr:hypothetical protein UFOVP338_69 [uncultured Caudovirales phage]
MKLAKAVDDLTPLIAEVKALHRANMAKYDAQLNQAVEMGLLSEWIKSDTPILNETKETRKALEALQNEAERRHVLTLSYFKITA